MGRTKPREIDKWIGPYKVRVFPWIDEKRIYFNVQWYAPGQSVERPPAWDKTVLISDNEEGRRLVYEFTHSLVCHIENMQLPKGAEITLVVKNKYQPRLLPQKCNQCGQEFWPWDKEQKYCSKSCRNSVFCENKSDWEVFSCETIS